MLQGTLCTLSNINSTLLLGAQKHAWEKIVRLLFSQNVTSRLKKKNCNYCEVSYLEQFKKHMMKVRRNIHNVDRLPWKFFQKKFNSLELVNKYLIKINFHIYFINILDLNRIGILLILLTRKSYPRTFPLKQQTQLVYFQNATAVANQCIMINFCLSLQIHEPDEVCNGGAINLITQIICLYFQNFCTGQPRNYNCMHRKKEEKCVYSIT